MVRFILKLYGQEEKHFQFLFQFVFFLILLFLNVTSRENLVNRKEKRARDHSRAY